MLTLLIAKEITMIIFYLSLPVFLIYLAYCEKKINKKHDNLVKDLADKLIEKADDEKPIMLNVNKEKLVDLTADKVIEELNVREMIQRRF